jgi:hypothetical protein
LFWKLIFLSFIFIDSPRKFCLAISHMLCCDLIRLTCFLYHHVPLSFNSFQCITLYYILIFMGCSYIFHFLLPPKVHLDRPINTILFCFPLHIMCIYIYIYTHTYNVYICIYVCI